MPQKVIPSGSQSVIPDPDKSQGKSGNNESGDSQGKGKAPENYLGDWKSKEDASKGLSELQSKIGSQGSELGTLRKQNNEMFTAFQNLQANQQVATAEPETQAAEELNSVMAEYAKLDFVEDAKASAKGAKLMQDAIALTAKMVKEDTLQETDAQVASLLQEKDASALQDKFLESNPNFSSLQEEGAFQALKSQNPMHDDFSAYYEHQATEAMTKVTELEAALEEAKKVANLAGGDEPTAKVFTKPGGDLRGGQQKKPQSVSELKAAAMETIRNMSGA